MAIISGRYGSVQRLLPIAIDSTTGAYTWQTVQPAVSAEEDLINKFTENLNPAELLLLQKSNGGFIKKDGDAVCPEETTVSSVTSWSLENTVTTVPFIASNTRGYKGQLEGLHSCTGNIAGLGGCPPIGPGQRFKFLGYVGPTNGQIDNVEGHVYSISAIANSLQIQINYQMSNPITWTVGWQSDWKEDGDELLHNQYVVNSNKYIAGNSIPTGFKIGDYINGNSIGIEGFWDRTIPPCATMMPSNSCTLKIGGRVRYNSNETAYAPGDDGYDGVGVNELQMCLVDANIQFQTEVANFANSCSAAAGGWQTCVVGATSCTLNANIHGDHYGIINKNHLPGSNHNVRLYIEGGKPDSVPCSSLAYWEFEKMFFGTFGGLNVDTTTNNPLQFSCAMEFNAYPGCDPGYIKYQPALERKKDAYGIMTYKKADPVYLIDLRPENEVRPTAYENGLYPEDNIA